MLTRRRNRNATLHPETDYNQIYLNLSAHEFPWDLNQALSLALFRTYAVPSIGRLLDQTGEFTGPTQKRYDDTALLLEAPVLHGLDSVEGRAAIRRINQMHRMYDISMDDLRYVLATFVVIPKRWIDAFGWPPWTTDELRASVNYHRELGRLMGISDIPETFTAFETLMDDYELEHFGYDAGARRVADATLSLMVGFFAPVPRGLVRRFSLALMDPPLLRALGYDEPSPLLRTLASRGLQARARMLRLTPSRRERQLFADSRRMRTYRDGYDVGALGTFTPTPGCPVRSENRAHVV